MLRPPLSLFLEEKRAKSPIPKIRPVRNGTPLEGAFSCSAALQRIPPPKHMATTPRVALVAAVTGEAGRRARSVPISRAESESGRRVAPQSIPAAGARRLRRPPLSHCTSDGGPALYAGPPRNATCTECAFCGPKSVDSPPPLFSPRRGFDAAFDTGIGEIRSKIDGEVVNLSCRLVLGEV